MCNRRFVYRSRAVSWLAEQVEEERQRVGLQAEEDAYAAAHAMELNREEKLC